MGLLGALGDMDVDKVKETVPQGILGGKAIQPYVNKVTGLTSAVKNVYNNFINNIKNIPTLINDMIHFPTFMKDLEKGIKYANYETLGNELSGKPTGSYFANIKKGYQISKRDRTDPIFHNQLRERLGKPIEFPPVKTLTQKELNENKRRNDIRKRLSAKRLTVEESLRLNRDENKNEI